MTFTLAEVCGRRECIAFQIEPSVGFIDHEGGEFHSDHADDASVLSATVLRDMRFTSELALAQRETAAAHRIAGEMAASAAEQRVPPGGTRDEIRAAHIANGEREAAFIEVRSALGEGGDQVRQRRLSAWQLPTRRRSRPAARARRPTSRGNSDSDTTRPPSWSNDAVSFAFWIQRRRASGCGHSVHSNRRRANERKHPQTRGPIRGLPGRGRAGCATLPGLRAGGQARARAREAALDGCRAP